MILKRKLTFILLLLAFFITACSVEQSPPAPTEAPAPTPTPTPAPTPDPAFLDEQHNDAILSYTTSPDDLNPSDDALPNVVVLPAALTEAQKTSFVKTFLREKGAYKDAPDEISYYDGNPVTEYYMDEENKKMCLILHVPSGEIYCAALPLDAFQKTGSRSYAADAPTYHPSYNPSYENFYDAVGRQTACAIYWQNTPYPVAHDYKISTNGQKIFLLFDNIEHEGEDNWGGKWIGYNGDVFNPADSDSDTHYTFTYDEKDRLQKMTKDAPKLTIEEQEPGKSAEYYAEAEQRDYTGEVDFSYRSDGSLRAVSYHRPTYLYGMTNSIGEIDYDITERAVFEQSYITHGELYNFYLYKNNEREPWLSVHLDSAFYDYAEKDGVKYGYGGASVSADLFQPVTDAPSASEIMNAYAEFLNGKSYIQDEHDCWISVDNIMNYPGTKYTYYDVNGDGIPELVLQGWRLYILSYGNGELSASFSCEHVEGDYYFVNGGKLYFQGYGHVGFQYRSLEDFNYNSDDGYQVIYYYNYVHDEATDTWTLNKESYGLSKGYGTEEQPITKQEYDKLVSEMSNDDQIAWHEWPAALSASTACDGR